MRWLIILVLILVPCLARAQQWQAESIRLIRQDLDTVAPGRRSDVRYLTLIEPEPKLRWQRFIAASGLLNATSLSRGVVPPTILTLGVGRKGERVLRPRHWSDMRPEDWQWAVLLRVRLSDYNQTPAQWDKTGNPTFEPLYHVWTYDEGKWKRAVAPWLLKPLGVQDAQAFQDDLFWVLRETGSPVPVLEARNYVWQCGVDFLRPAGYSSWLGVVDEASFERLIRSNKQVLALREAVSDSGVANEARAIDRGGRGDGDWITYDQVDHLGIGNRNPLEVTDPKLFVFDAKERIGRMDNGWWATGLFSAKGVRQDSAPDGVGYNKKSLTNDGKIHNFLACFTCHDDVAGNGGLKPFHPYFRNLHATPGPVAAKHDPKFVEQYLTPIEPWADVDKRIYAAAVMQATGQEPHVFAQALLSTYTAYARPLDLEDAAFEHGVTVQVFVATLHGDLLTKGAISNTDGNWVVPGQRRTRIGRTQFAEAYNKTQLVLRGLPRWPLEIRNKVVGK